MKTLTITLSLLLVASSLPAQIDRVTGRAFATRSEVIAVHGMAATSQPLATQIAIDVLRKGGSAVDAAIAANAALGLMEPTGSGIGGDLFAIVWDAKSQKLHGLNASGRSPRGLSYEELSAELAKLGRKTIPPQGFLPISVPGAVDGWFELHGRFGKLPMREVLAPAIRYAEEGFPVSELISYYWKRSAPVLSRQPGAFKETFTTGGRGPEKGEIFRNPALANSYRLLATKGRDAFYRGEITAKIDAFFRANGGYLRKEDFEQHRSLWVEPVSVNYRGMGSGIVVPGLGFGFQDRGEMFTFEEGHANVYAPGKRPFHTIIPAFVMKDRKPWLSFGVMGGAMQPQGHVQILVNMIDFGMNLQEAGDAARWQHNGSSEPTGEQMSDGGSLEVESGTPWKTLQELSQRGHDVRFGLGGYGGYQAILWNEAQGVYYGASESRKDGQAAGY